MNPYTVVILSAKPENVARCLAALRQHEPTQPPVIVVCDRGIEAHLPPAENVQFIMGAPTFCFAANANRGIAAAGTNDVILLNDDALLATLNGFTLLQQAAQNFGVTSARVLGRCCNPRQRDTVGRNVAEADFLAFVCVYLPRTTIERVGLLDEQFTPGTWEDNDYCQRVKQAGLPLGICGQCAVAHDQKNGTTFETLPSYRAVLDANRKRYEAKWSPFQVRLSVCVCSIFTREAYLARLLACLRPQFAAVSGVEFLLAVDGGEQSIGAKRNRLLQQARGEFIVFIDDDDLVTPDYLSQVLSAIVRNPGVDCITYRSRRFENGVFEADCIYSLANTTNSGREDRNGIRTYLRWPYHVTPIRRSLAVQVAFPEIDHTEDTQWVVKLKPLLRTECHLPLPLYEYWWRSDRSAETTHLKLVGKK